MASAGRRIATNASPAGAEMAAAASAPSFRIRLTFTPLLYMAVSQDATSSLAGIVQSIGQTVKVPTEPRGTPRT